MSSGRGIRRRLEYSRLGAPGKFTWILSIRRGALDAEERYRINDHIVQSIAMLSRMSFTRHLRRVPEMAGGRHERVDGKGYPKGLREEEMSVEARVMAVADVFAALTASDRPHKKAKTLPEALLVMAKMHV